MTATGSAAAAVVLAVVLVVVVFQPGRARPSSPASTAPGAGQGTAGSNTGHHHHPGTTTTTSPVPRWQRRYGVGLWQVSLTEPGRVVEPPHSSAGEEPGPRMLVTQIRYPATTSPNAGEIANAPPAAGSGPFPLVVFGPGYLQLPQNYAPLLDAWTRAGFVVAAPAFPLTNPATPGGPDEYDQVNQPADLSFLITSLIHDSGTPGNPLSGLVDTTEVAATGHSDGGNTVLALADNSRYRDARVKAVVVLSGQEWTGGFGVAGWFPAGSPPLLAVQGTADPVNPPQATDQFFAAAPQPKYLLCLQGSGHLDPYSTTEPAESLVARASIDFLDHYLYRAPGSLEAMQKLAASSSLGQLTSTCPAPPPPSSSTPASSTPASSTASVTP
ncbi:MAG: alpha/beta hydrolase family protein [Acidimicrobiales bacterium]